MLFLFSIDNLQALQLSCTLQQSRILRPLGTKTRIFSIKDHCGDGLSRTVLVNWSDPSRLTRYTFIDNDIDMDINIYTQNPLREHLLVFNDVLLFTQVLWLGLPQGILNTVLCRDSGEAIYRYGKSMRRACKHNYKRIKHCTARTY